MTDAEDIQSKTMGMGAAKTAEATSFERVDGLGGVWCDYAVDGCRSVFCGGQIMDITETILEMIVAAYYISATIFLMILLSPIVILVMTYNKFFKKVVKR